MAEALQPNEIPRVPPPSGTIQVNFCKNPTCGNFGIPASDKTQSRGRHVKPGNDRYKLTGTPPAFICLKCGEQIPAKSNEGIAEELNRLLVPLAPPPQPSCQTEGCPNAGVSPSAAPGQYWSHTKTKAGTPRFRCKACKKTLTMQGLSTLRQRKSHLNSEIFRALTQKMPLSCVAEFSRVSPKTVYRKIDFIHRQCLLFASNRERRLPSMAIDRMYVCVDRMDHIINWTNRADKRNITIQAVGSAELKSGYVLALHVNYDDTLSKDAVALAAIECADHEKQPPFRRFARLWLPAEYELGVKLAKGNTPSTKDMSSIDDWIEAVYADAAARGDVEQSDHPRSEWKPPGLGLLVHAEYTLYAHFLYLKSLLAGVGKIRFFLDQESGIRAACLSAFADEVLAKDCDAFYVSISKGVTKEKALALVGESQRKLNEYVAQYGYECLKLQDQRRQYLKDKMHTLWSQKGKWGDRWLEYPFPNMAEPEKRVCYLTNLKADWFDYDDEHLANLLLKATLHPIDRFFMQTRRKTSMLERPITSSSVQGRRWYGYSAYDPAMAAKMLEIYRVYYNFVKVGDDRKTPAMRLGLAKGPCTVEDIIYYSPES